MNIKHLWWKIAELKNSQEALNEFNSAIKPYYYPYMQKLNKGIFAIEINNSKLGFFANLNWCLFILYYSKKLNLIPYLELTSLNYIDSKRGNDWFKYYFNNLTLLENEYEDSYRPKYVTRIKKIKELRLPGWCYHELTIDYAAKIFNDSINIKPEILNLVDEYKSKHFLGKKVLGVHFRGTDKIIEAPRVTWSYCEKTIRNYLNDQSDTDALFIASDEQPFIQHIYNVFPDIEILYHHDHYRSENGMAIHSLESNGNNYLKGLDALINSLLLSNCNTIIRSSSFLSAWSSIFNPNLKVILLNEPNTNSLWFPEVEIMKTSLIKYLPKN